MFLSPFISSVAPICSSVACQSLNSAGHSGAVDPPGDVFSSISTVSR